MLQQNEDFSDIEGLEAGHVDPLYGHLQATEAASDTEETSLGVVMAEIGDDLYSKGGAMDIAQMIENDDRDLFEMLPDIAVPLLQKAHDTAKMVAPEETSTIMFGEEGVVHQVNDALFEIAEQVGHPDAQNQDIYAASLIAIYNKIGEHLQKTGDTESIDQVAQLGIDMSLTQPDGSMQTPEQAQVAAPKTGVASGIEQALGGQGSLLNV